MDRRVMTVFGGSGFIGRHLVQRLAGCRLDRPRRRPRSGGGELPQDVRRSRAGGAAVRRRHRAADGREGGGRRRMGDQSRRHPLRARPADVPAHPRRRRRQRRQGRAGRGAERLVQMSALGAGSDAAALYARTKAAGEEAAKNAFAGVSITRPSVVFGPGGRVLQPVCDDGADRADPAGVSDPLPAGLRRRCRRGIRPHPRRSGDPRPHLRARRPAHHHVPRSHGDRPQRNRTTAPARLPAALGRGDPGQVLAVPSGAAADPGSGQAAPDPTMSSRRAR